MSQNHNTLFATTVEKLLKGEIICSVSNEALFNFLEEPINQEDVDSYLRRIERTLKQTQDGLGYFSALRHINTPASKAVIKQNFNQMINDIEPLVRWLQVAQSAESLNSTLNVGDILRGSELLSAIESAPALIDELDKLSRSRLFGNTSTGAKKQLDSILRILCEHSYLVTSGSSGSLYIATAKWSRFYDLLQFISSHEQIEKSEPEQEQKELIS